MSKNLLDGVYEIPYYVSNGGDGSASVMFPQDMEAASKADENQYAGWGEPSTGTLKIVIKDGKVFYEGDKVTFGEPEVTDNDDEPDDEDDEYEDDEPEHLDVDIDTEVIMEAKKVK